jgi:hypothetical protein
MMADNVTPMPPPGKRHRATGQKKSLTIKQDLALCNLMIAEYTPSGKTDREFADYATEKLGLPVGVVKDHTIKHRRIEFTIPNNRARSAPVGADTAMLLAHELQIKEQQEQINKIKTWINVNFPSKGPRSTI